MSTILLIDDQPISNFITKKVLENFGIQTLVVDYTNPVEAFKILNLKKDLILFLDLNMPEMNGWQFLEKMQSENIQHRTILLTASTSIEDLQKAKKFACVKGYLTKPLDSKKIQEFFKTENLFDQASLS